MTWTVLCELAFGLGGVHAVAGDGGELLAAVVLIVNVVGDVFEILHVGPASVVTLLRLGRCVMVKRREERNKDESNQKQRENSKSIKSKCFFPHFSFKGNQLLKLQRLRQTAGSLIYWSYALQLKIKANTAIKIQQIQFLT